MVDKILDTADALFYGQGYNATGINQIIEEADIAKASLYKHFESKSDLLLAYVRRLHGQWFERLQAHVNGVADPKEKLLAVFDHYRHRQQLRKFGGCPFIKANAEAGWSDPRVTEEIQRTKQQFKNFIKELVLSSGHKQLLTHEDLAETIFLMTEGGVTAAAVFKQSDDLEAAREIVRKLL